MLNTLTLKDLLLNHLEFTFEREAWQPSLLMAVEGLTAAQAAWKPGPNRHSIWQIVRHVTHWKQATLEAWNGTQPLFEGREITPRFHEVMRSDWQEIPGDEAAWQADLTALRAVSDEIKKKATSLDLETWGRPFPREDWGPAVLRVLRLATHDIYHAGQIRYLRAMQDV
jgi:uncharacterized damage-inducible protein DinB